MSTPSEGLNFGLALPIFANPGAIDFRTPSFEGLNWGEIKSYLQHAEELGYDSVWVADHMFLGQDGAILESWTTLSAIAGLTSKMRLVNIHLGNSFRHAPLVAKMAATLDVISDGRVDFFLDPAWRDKEHVAYGFIWEPDREIRTRRLGEAIDVVRALWTGEPVHHRGEFYELAGAVSMPRPIQDPGPKVIIGEAFDDETLRLVAEKADSWNSMPAGVEVLRDKVNRVNAACIEVGRDPSTLHKSLETQVLILEDESEWETWLAHWAGLRDRFPAPETDLDFRDFVETTNPELDASSSTDRFLEEFLIGTREQVIERLHHYREIGIDEIVCWFMDFPSRRSLEILATEIAPQMKGHHAK